MREETRETVVVGGRGKTGRRVVDRLRALGRSVRPVSRGAEVPFDWHDEATWGPALRGAGAMYLTYHPDLAMPGAAERVRRVSARAVDAGVERIVLLAGRGEPQVHPAEDAVRESGARWTILECAFFDQNFDDGVLAPVEDAIFFPGGRVAEPFVDCDDIADAVVAALTDPRHAGETYELTGPRTLTFAEVADEIGAAAGRPIRYVPVSFAQYAEMLAPHMPPEHVAFLIELFEFLMDGHNAHVADGVERALGRPAKDFREYARGVAAAGGWS